MSENIQISDSKLWLWIAVIAFLPFGFAWHLGQLWNKAAEELDAKYRK